MGSVIVHTAGLSNRPLTRLMHIVGARPNFIKVAPVIRACATNPAFSQTLVHTGQHYDANMSDVFFNDLGLPKPDVNLEVGSGSHAAQTAEIMVRFEAAIMRNTPDLLIVYGDVNSTIAVALVAAKLGVPVAHVEAGLRSFDRSMPEEINRILTDQISSLLFTPSADADDNLRREGIAPSKIYMVGNVMIDTLARLLPKAESRWQELATELANSDSAPALQNYGLVTLHRPSNVDDLVRLAELLEALSDIAADLPLIFPVHPRTRQRIKALNSRCAEGIALVDPVGYLDFLALQKNARLVITDSGGIQEETTYLGVPCLTMRENTERPVTISLGTNILVGNDLKKLQREVRKIHTGATKPGNVPPLWDGNAGDRIARILAQHFDCALPVDKTPPKATTQ
jgi:UDP-N-acetylglucosamine 2-epimerase (non-hydrolysing)